MTHSWCSDPARDEAVRAAEDGRDGPRPTLEEAIAAASPLPGRVEGTHWADWERLRAERDAAIRERDQGKEFWMGELRSRTAERDAARARVAELEAQVADCNILLGDRWREAVSAVTGESAPAASGAAGNSPAVPVSSDPVAYFVKWAEKDWGVQDQTFRTLERAQDYIKDEKSEDENPQIVPLFAAPQAAPGWLTAEERSSIQHAANLAKASWSYSVAQELENILARSTPPEVVLPELHTRSEVNEANHKSPCLWLRRPDVIEALAAAGVTVKEVGRE